jgi:GNAT superfamily N-acetyltransferase
MREGSETTLKIDAVMVSEGARRQRVGTALMEAAEDRGRKRGATRSVVISYAHGPTSVSFYEDRMSYTRKTIGFSKPL